MNEQNAKIHEPTGQLRIWIPIVLLLSMVLARFVPDMMPNGPSMTWAIAAFGPMLAGLLILLWWLFASRATWKERILGFFVLIVLFVGVSFLLDRSMREAPFIVMTIPMGIAGFAIGAILASRRIPLGRTAIALFVAALAMSVSALVRTDGVWGDFAFGLDWRWNASPEEQFLASRSNISNGSTVELVAPSTELFRNAEWPGFRGPNRDGAQHGLAFDSDWRTHPPKELWRVKIGPAWSSFAVAGNFLVTQEQRGELEAIVCYNAANGKEVWAHTVQARFFESLGGLGPRATPTISDGFVVALGAEGKLVKLAAENGEVVWEKDVRAVAERAAPPMWGFSCSPLVVDGTVIVHAGGKGNKGVLAFDFTTGELAWSAPSSEMSYSSPQMITLFGRSLIAMLTDSGAQLLEPATGKVALDYEWKHSGYRALQPQFFDGNKLLIPTGLGSGTRLVELVEDSNKLAAKELWTSRDMKPDFNDLVVHKGYVYGFDDKIFACIDVNDGSLKWKDGRYGKGQVLLLADSDLLLVVSEKGDLLLLDAKSDSQSELARLKALAGKTWNHPVVIDNHLFLRNAAEAVCYELPTITGVQTNIETD